MTRDILTNKWIIGAASLLLIITAGCYIWYQHDIAPYKQQAEKTAKLLQQLKKERKAAAKAVTKDETKAPAENNDTTAKKPRTTDTTPVTRNTDPTQVQVGVPAQTAETADVQVSPYGFGLYPEVPEGFIENVGTTIWMDIARFGPLSPDIINVRSQELMDRVLIKLWQEDPGKQRYMEGAFYRNGKVYVNYSNRAYVRYKTIELPDGTTNRVITSWTAGTLESPTPDPANPFQSNSDQIRSEIELIDLDKEDPGINPYDFLGL